MDGYDRTTRVPRDMRRAAPVVGTGGVIMTVFDGNSTPRTVSLDSFGKPFVTFGRAPTNDIVLTSPLVSGDHGRFSFRNGTWVIEDRGAYSPKPSTNGLICNNMSVLSRVLSNGDFIRIDDGVETVENGVLFVFSDPESTNKWETFDDMSGGEITIGRAPTNRIVLPHVSVSKNHARIVRQNDGFYLIDNGSTNGVVINNKKVSGREKLHEKDVITITNSKIIFTSNALFYCYYRSGISVDAMDVVITRGKKKVVTCNHVTLSIRPGELVGIIGGSGAGKSTVLNCMCGYLEPASGDVYINGTNLYKNFDAVKKLIGYVPQSDIVYDNLTLHDMLLYTAKLRLPGDVSVKERESMIDRAIETVELKEKKNTLIKSLSGGQRKRASIAVELLSDPNLMFLDEPASGLDPGTERNLMKSLRRMADGGKTVILVTHSTLQLKLCDKIVFMGRGGNLCFCGSYDDALRFFGVDDVVDIYNLINDHSPEWRDRFRQISAPEGLVRQTQKSSKYNKERKGRQFFVLCARYLKLIFNDRMRTLLLMIQAPVLALLISLVASGDQYEVYGATKSLLFALSCSAFWIGMLNAIQEVCKEKTIMKREYMTGLSLTSYIMSKLAVLGIMCLIQSLLLVGVFAAIVGLPGEGVMTAPFIEILISTFLTAVAAAAMGLFVSSLFTNADRAMTVAPILLMPQILFSGMIFNLEGATETVSILTVCRWSMEGLGTTANLNSLPAKIQEMEFPPTFEEFYEFTAEHLLGAWGALLITTVVFIVLARVVISRVGKEKS